jgi:hypothetical protein
VWSISAIFIELVKKLLRSQAVFPDVFPGGNTTPCVNIMNIPSYHRYACPPVDQGNQGLKAGRKAMA